MIIRFETIKDLKYFLIRNKKLKTSFRNGYKLFDLKFELEIEFINYLENYSIIEIVFKEIRIKEIYKIDSFIYEMDYIILNTNYLNSLEFNTFVNPNIQERLLTVKEVCQILGVTKPTVYKLFNTNQLSYYEILSQRKIKLTDLQKYIESKRKK